MGKRQLLVGILAMIMVIQANGQIFSEVSTSAGIDHVFDVGDRHFGGGAAVLDYDNDGFEDVYITGGVNPEGLFHNNGDGTFTEVHLAAGLGAMDALLTQGAIAGDINNDGYRDLYITVRCETADLGVYVANRLWLNNGDNTFSDISATAGILSDSAFSTSASFGDYNLDGLLDIYVINYLKRPFEDVYADTTGDVESLFDGKENNLYLNNGDLTFTDVAMATSCMDSGTGLAGTFTDFDNDHDMDIYAVNDFGWVVQNGLYENNYPADNFTDISVASGANAQINGMGVAVGDYDEDGYMDYYVTNMLTNILYHNNGDGTFTDVAKSTGVRDAFLPLSTDQACASYVPGDGYVGQDTFVLSLEDELGPLFSTQTFIISLTDTFTMGSSSVSGDTSSILLYNEFQANNCFFGMDSSIVVSSEPMHGTVELHNNEHYGSIGWGCNFFDYNNDSYLDLFVCNGILTPVSPGEIPENPNSLYHNNGDGTFTMISDSAGVQDVTMGRGSITFDYDHDGDLDVIVVNAAYPDTFDHPYSPHSNLFRNDAPAVSNWLKVDPVGVYSNRDALGARVRISMGGRSLIREIDGGSSFLSNNSRLAHFGLGASDMIDTVEVIYPGGCRNFRTGVSANQTLEILEDHLYSDLPDTLIICPGESVALNPGTGTSFSYAWSSGETTEDITVSPEVTTTYAVSATEGVCDLMDQVVVWVHPEVAVSIDPIDTTFVETDLAVTLTATPLGGEFTGPGVSAGMFSPGSAGVGTHEIVYEYTDSSGCTFTTSQMVVVTDAVGIEEEKLPFGVSVYPNPAGDQFTLRIEAIRSGDLAVRLTDVLGRELMSFTPQVRQGINEFEVSSPKISSGSLIFLEIRGTETVFTLKLLKE